MQENMENQNLENKKEKKSKKKWLLLLLLLLLVSFSSYQLYQNYMDRQNEVQAGSLGEIGRGIMPGMTPEEIQQYLNEQADKSKFMISLNSYLEFDTADSKGYLRLINGKNSAYAVKLTIKLEGTDTVVYKSALVKPEQYIEYITLKKKLQPGVYRAIGIYEFYDATYTDTKVSEQQVILTLDIKG